MEGFFSSHCTIFFYWNLLKINAKCLFFSYKIANIKYLACHFKPPIHKIPLVCVTCPCLSVWQLYQLYNRAFAKLSKYTRVYQTSFKIIRPNSSWIILLGICRLGLHVYTGVDPGIFEKGGGAKFDLENTETLMVNSTVVCLDQSYIYMYMILMNQCNVMVTATNTAAVAQCSAYILPLFPLPFEMKAIMK